MPKVPTNPTLNGPPIDPAHDDLHMDQDGPDLDSIEILTPGSLFSPSTNLVGASMNSAQIPVTFGLSNETPAVVVEGLNLMEGLILEKAMETAKKVLDPGFVEVVPPFVQKQAHGTRKKKSMS
jgi:hypothetical protein